MRVKFTLLAVLIILSFMVNTVNAEPTLLLRAGDSENVSVVYVEDDVCYWYQGSAEFIAKIANEQINFYFEGQKFLSFTGINEVYVVAITYDQEGTEAGRTKAISGSIAYEISKVIFDYYNS